MTTFLVLHGPNLPLKGQVSLDEALAERADALGVELTTFQGNSEGALLDEVQRQHLEVDAVIVNPGVLAPGMWALAEAVTLVKKPTVEVVLSPLPAERGPSALVGVVKATCPTYVAALELLVKELGVKPPVVDEGAAPQRARSPGRGSRSEKSIGRKVDEPTPDEPARSGKTIGRRVDGPAAKTAAASAPAGSLTRAVVREKLKARLGGSLGADALAAWARTEWSKLNSGGACEETARATIDGVLLTVMGGAKASDAIVLAQLAKLE